MIPSEAVVLLKGLSPKLLEGLTFNERRELLEFATVRRFQPGALMTRQGFPAKTMFLLVEGRARFFCTTVAGRKASLLWIYPGEICGLASLLLREVEYLLSVETVKPSVALSWDRGALRPFLAKYPQLLDNGLQLTFEYIRLYRTAHICAIHQTARQRLAAVLGDLANAIGKKVADGVEVSVNNEELAIEANVTVFTASRLLNEWQRKGFLVKTRGKLVLRLPAAELLRHQPLQSTPAIQ